MQRGEHGARQNFEKSTLSGLELRSFSLYVRGRDGVGGGREGKGREGLELGNKARRSESATVVGASRNLGTPTSRFRTCFPVHRKRGGRSYARRRSRRARQRAREREVEEAARRRRRKRRWPRGWRVEEEWRGERRNV